MCFVAYTAQLCPLVSTYVAMQVNTSANSLATTIAYWCDTDSIGRNYKFIDGSTGHKVSQCTQGGSWLPSIVECQGQ